MTTAPDVAALIRVLAPDVGKKKLQKLVYYSQAWALVWLNRPLFEAPIEAWVLGPVQPDVYRDAVGDGARVVGDERRVVETVVASYGNRSGAWLSALTHNEPPWADAREGLPESAQSNREITKEAIRAFFVTFEQPPFTFTPSFVRGLDLVAGTPPKELVGVLSDRTQPADAFLKFLESGDEDRPL